MAVTAKLIKTKRFGDDRGWFSESYSAARLAEHGIVDRFVQDNLSYSAAVGTIRGIHFQSPPHAQAKLVSCLRGRIIDYVVDLRHGSPTFGAFQQAELSADNGDQLYVPVGFGHAFVTLEPDVQVMYKVSDIYAPECDGGIRWDDASIGIDWPLPANGPTLSDKDRRLPTLATFVSPFIYEAEPLGPLER